MPGPTFELGQNYELGQSEYIMAPGARLFTENGKLVESMGDAVSTVQSIMTMLRIPGMIGGVYHGYKRNQSIGWALAWGAAGYLSPVITGVVSYAQGFGKKK